MIGSNGTLFQKDQPLKEESATAQGELESVLSAKNPHFPEISDKTYMLLGFFILLSALVLRLYNLGERVFHHDESVHGHFTLKLLEHGEYVYDPAYHGPFLFHSTAAVFHYLGASDSTARLLPALFGVAVILLLFSLKKQLGKRGVLISAFLLSFSPSMVYFSRFFRNDMIIVFCTLAAITGGLHYLKNIDSWKRVPYLLFTAVSLAIAMASKENAYMIYALFGSYIGLYFLYRAYSVHSRRAKGTSPSGEALSSGKPAGFLSEVVPVKRSQIASLLFDVLLSGALFYFIVMLFYTSFFHTPETFISVVERAFSHWLEMHRIQRIGGPFYYYLPILLDYESPILLFGTAGILYFLRQEKKDPFFLFLSYWAVTNFLLYSYLQEKVPWLVVHIVLPFGILAGAYLGELLPQLLEMCKSSATEFSNPGLESGFKSLCKRKKVLIAGVLACTLLFSLFQCISVNYYGNMDPAERMTYTQATPDIRELMIKIDSFTLHPSSLNICLMDPDNLYWPLPWYLRDYKKVNYARQLPFEINYDVIIVPTTYDTEMDWRLEGEGYTSMNFTLRPGKEVTMYYKANLDRLKKKATEAK